MKIKKTNWLIPPNNRWSFQNMSSIFKTTQLTKSNSPFILPQNLQPIDSLEFDGLDGKKTLRQELDSSFTDAFIVLKNGEIIFEEYQNDMQPESLHLMNSVSKSFVGMLIGILVEEKKLRQHFNEFMLGFHDFVYERKEKNEVNVINKFLKNLVSIKIFSLKEKFFSRIEFICAAI